MTGTMAEQNQDQEKTEEPTLRKLEEARKQGNVSLSKEVSSVVLMAASVLVMVGGGHAVYERTESLMERFFMDAAEPIGDPDQAIEVLESALMVGLEMMMPLLVVLMLTALLVNMAQTKGAFSMKTMEPKASKISPASGFKRIFSSKGAAELIKGFLKLAIVGLVIFYTLRSDVDEFLSYILLPIDQSLPQAGAYVLGFLTQVLTALFLLSIADAIYQRYQHRKDLRMTKQEVKDEFKSTEGDPKVKSQRKQFGLSLRQKKRLDHAVLASDVVVTNPTHYAVALRYDPDQNDAPVVMAKGKRLKALRIKELAREYEIPMVENRPVAQALFASAKEDEAIPADLYKAVAEILAYVYKKKNQS